jgi:iron-sulfur cluster repair protein YtfE (RIC family)
VSSATTPFDDSTIMPGDGLVQELIWVHNMLRRDLETVRRLAAEVASGASPETVQEQIAKLETSSPLWKLRLNCLTYCRFVHHHHKLEDTHLFPALRHANPELGSVVDRLEADHLQIGGNLDEIGTATFGLAQEDTIENRQRVVDALNALADHLLEHLAFEEESISPTLRTMDNWFIAR